MPSDKALNRTTPIDFTKSFWGHAIHADTWHEVKDYGPWFQRWKDKRAGRKRYSVMVHVSPTPKIGQQIKYRTENGERLAQIYNIDYCRDPKDMFKLHIFTEQPK